MDFRNKSSIMHDQYKGDVTSQYKANGLLVTFKRLLGDIKYFYIDQDVKAGCRKLKNPIHYYIIVHLSLLNFYSLRVYKTKTI